MAGYFSYFPKIAYNLDDTNINNVQLVTNILARSTFLKEIVDNTAIYYEYQMKDTDTPEIIADKIYNNPTRHWIVLLFNKILNPQYEFPLEQSSLEEYVKNKYNQTLEQSQTTIHHYELIVIQSSLYNGFESSSTVSKYTVNEDTVNFTTGALGNRSVPNTADTYLDLGDQTISMGSGVTININQRVRAVSNYTYELELNEERRTIKLIDVKYITKIEDEFRRLMQNG